MKKLVVGGAALAAVLLAAPWGMGHVARGRIDRGIDKLITQAPYLRVADRQWKGGWFRSEQELTFELVLPGLGGLTPAAAIARADDPAPARNTGFMHTAAAPDGAPEVTEESMAAALAAAEAAAAEAEAAGESAGADDAVDEPPPAAAPKRAAPLRFKIRNEVLHGPVLGLSGVGVARVQTHPVWSDEVRAKLASVFGSGDPVVRIQTRLGFMGGGTTTLAGDARTVPLDRLGKAGRKGAMSWDAFHLQVGYSRHADQIDFKGRAPRFEITGETAGEQVLFTDIAAEGSSERIVGDLYGGDASFVIGRTRIAVARTPPVEVEQIHYRGGTRHADGFMDMGLQLGSGAIRAEAIKSTGLEISEVHYDFTLKHLHIDTLDKLMAATRAMYQGGFEGAELSPDAVLAPFREHGVALLQHAPEFVMDRIGIVTPDGEGVLKGVLKFDGLTEQDVAAGIMGILPRLVADVRLEVAQALVEKLPNGAMMAGAGVDNGFLKRDGDKLVSHIEFRAGELKVNGKSQRVPLPGMAAPAPQQPSPEELPEPLAN